MSDEVSLQDLRERAVTAGVEGNVTKMNRRTLHKKLAEVASSPPPPKESKVSSAPVEVLEDQSSEVTSGGSTLEEQLAALLPNVVAREPGAKPNSFNELLKPQNLPSRFTFAYGSLSNSGEDLARWTSNGWVRVPSKAMSKNPHVSDKIYLPIEWEDYNGFVMVMGCLLLIADRRIVEERKRGVTERWNERTTRSRGGRVGEKVSDRIVELDHGRTYRRVSETGLREVRAEDLFGGDG